MQNFNPVYLTSPKLAFCSFCISPAHVRFSSSQHAAQPRFGRTDAAEGGDGDTQEGQLPTRPRAQPPKTELRGAQTTAQSRPARVGRPAAAAAAGTIHSHKHTHVRGCLL